MSGLHQTDGLGALKFHGGQILQVEADVVVAGLGVIGLLQERRAFVHGLLHLVPVIHYGLAANPDEAAVLKCADLQMGILHQLGVGGLVGAAAEIQLILIDHVKRRDNVTIDNVTEALDRAVANGVKTLVVQPTHLMDGLEYNDLVEEIGQYSDAFDQVSIGAPLLTSDEDFQAVAQAIVNATKEYDDGKTAICFMGHGTEAESNQVYSKMQTVLTDMGCDNYFVGTVEATPSLDDVLKLVQAGDYERVVLEPLMVVAGDHANNDMAGDDPDSWKSTFEAAGYEVVPVVRGLGELENIQKLYVQHAQAAIDALNQ